MSSGVLKRHGVMALLNRSADQRILGHAERLRDITVDLHVHAPRGGVNFNKYGQRRSGPEEPPAIETGALLSRLEAPPTPIPNGYAVMVNLALLEQGTTRMEPRPMGLMAVARLKREVKASG